MNDGNMYAERAYQRSSMDTAELEKNVEEYPFSSLAGFLLLYHYKKTDHPSFKTFAKKNVLNFSNPLWLELLLSRQEKEQNNIHTNDAVIVNSQSLKDADDAHELPAKSLDEHLSKLPVKEVSINESLPAVIQETGRNNEVGNHDKPTPVFELKNKNEFAGATFSQQENVAESDDNITFDPLHTIDYFASQGIHLNEEEIPTTDKLGSQMKSFTAWLKSMKKLHPAKSAEENSGTEKQVQVAAEASNLNTDVLTEAMAEVLIKQDKKEKAIDMYNKLSLINPAKSAYFAAKIEGIKQR